MYSQEGEAEGPQNDYIITFIMQNFHMLKMSLIKFLVSRFKSFEQELQNQRLL